MDSEGKSSNQGEISETAVSPETTSSDQPELSVVIPCLNEAVSIGDCIDKALAAFRTAGVRGEVVVADNGSTDGSMDIAREHGARVVHAEVRGYGSALRKGIEEARGNLIIMGDADGAHDFSEIPKFLAKSRQGFDLVLGNRLRGENKPGSTPWLHRYFANPAFTWMLNTLFGGTVGDAFCGMRCFHKDLYQRAGLRCTGMEFALEFVIKARRLGASVTEIPITQWPDKRGRPPHLRPLRDGWRSVRFMLLSAPNWLFLFPGTTLFLLGAAAVAWLLPGPRHLGYVVVDVRTLLLGMTLALAGTQIIFLGLFAKAFTFAERFSRSQHSLERWLNRLTMEQGLIAGAILTLAGGAGALAVVGKWVASGCGPMNHVRVVIFLAFGFLLGIQVFFSSFFIGMLGINRGVYMGDFDGR